MNRILALLALPFLAACATETWQTSSDWESVRTMLHDDRAAAVFALQLTGDAALFDAEAYRTTLYLDLSVGAAPLTVADGDATAVVVVVHEDDQVLVDTTIAVPFGEAATRDYAAIPGVLDGCAPGRRCSRTLALEVAREGGGVIEVEASLWVWFEGDYVRVPDEAELSLAPLVPRRP